VSRWILALGFLILGLVAGLSYGWWIAPVQYVDTTPASLREDYRADYVLMVAEGFGADHDSETARRRLAVLGGRSPAESCLQAIGFARTAAYADHDLMLLEDLNRAMQSLSPLSAPLGTSP
jgi:hypothetical protein